MSAGASLLGLERLEPRLLLNAAQPWAAAAPIPLDVPADGQATVEGLAQGAGWSTYRVVAAATGRLTLLGSPLDPGVDPSLSVYDSHGELLGSNDDVRPLSSDSLVRLRVRAGQVLNVLAATARPGRYSLCVVSEPADDIGNTPQTALTVSLDARGSARRPGQINYPGDVDMLALTAPVTGQMHITMAGLEDTAPAGRQLAVLDEAGELVGAAAGAQITLDVVAGGVYYVQAAGAADAGGEYRIVVRSEGIAPEWPAPDDDPADTQPTAEVRLVDGRQELFITGTGGQDAVTLGESENLVTLTLGAQAQVFAGPFAGITIRTGGGADTIRLAHTLLAHVRVEAGDGADSIFEAGPSGAWLDGGGGDDLIVSLGGGVDRVLGGGGLDSLWGDWADLFADVSAAERAGGAFHRVAEFEQPFTRDESSLLFVSPEIAGQDLGDPLIGSPARGYANFADVPLFVDGPRYDDVEQGAVGDCYYLACLAGYARSDPQLIRQMIAPLGDGSFAVRFYRQGREVFLRLDADLPVTGAGGLAYAGLGSDGELWVPLLEKAYAFFRYGQNSYASISGGWMTPVYRELTNAATATWWMEGKPAAQVYAYVANSLAAGYNVTVGSRPGGAGPIVSSHAYAVMSAQSVQGQMFVTVFNPWGVDGRPHDADSQDGLLRLSMSQFIDAFTTVAVSYV